MKREKEKALIKTAILNEREGEIFYNLAAEKSDNPEAKQAFLFLAKEEVEHREWLERIYNKLVNDNDITLEDRMEEDTASPEIFTEATRYPETGSLEVSVFGIGIKMEMASIGYYREAAENSDIPELAELFKVLIEWEGKHLEMLEKIYDQLKEEWWQQQGFDPA